MIFLLIPALILILLSLVFLVNEFDGAALASFLVGLSLLAFGVGGFIVERGETYEHNRDLVEQCISEGGHPEYTFNRRGYITDFLGCVK